MHKQSLFLVLFPLLLPPSCWFSPSSSSGLLLKTKDEGMHDTNSGLFSPLFLNFVSVCGSRRGRCTRLAVGNFNPDCHVSQLFHLWRHVVSLSKSQITKKKKRLQNTLQRVPTMPPPPSLPERGVSSQPDSLSAPSSHVPPTWLNTINRPSEDNPRGSLVQTACTSPPLSLCKQGTASPNLPTPPPVSQKQTPNHGISTPNH